MIRSRVRCTLASALVVSAFLAICSPFAALASSWPPGVARVAVPTTRVGNNSVYSTAVHGALRAYPGWQGVHDVVIVSAARAAASDVDAASSLCWAYDAPMLLTGVTTLPTVTRNALAAIVSENGTVTVHVVGSATAVSSVCVDRIRSVVGTSTIEQPWKTASRYSMAAMIAARVRLVASADGRTVPKVAFLANGSSASNLWDASAVAAVSRRTGIPILFTSANGVPATTAMALAAAGNPRVIVVGGAGSVPPSLYGALHASERWGGSTHFATAVAVASRAMSKGWSSVSTVAIAATPHDAAIGSLMVGRAGGVTLFSTGVRLDKVTWSLLASHASTLAVAYGVGGVGTVSSAQIAEMSGAPAVPWFAPGEPGRFVGRRARVAGHVGGNATTVSVYVAGRKVQTVAVRPWGAFVFTSVAMPSRSFKVEIVAGNPGGTIAKTSKSATRLKYPSATCIVIDKSDFKLYWVMNNRLVKMYPIAVGRAHLETPAPATWKILAKYHTSPGSVYGPRKLRLFRKRGGHYVRTRYGIHGTNQPWVIGTKASHGCIRMYNRDVLELFPQVPLGTMVYTRP